MTERRPHHQFGAETHPNPKKDDDKEGGDDFFSSRDDRSKTATMGSGSGNLSLIALIFCAGMLAWFLLMKLPQHVPSPAAKAQMLSLEAEGQSEGVLTLMENDGGGVSVDVTTPSAEETAATGMNEDYSEEDYSEFRPVSRFSGDLADDVDFEHDYNGDEADGGDTSETREVDAAEAWLGEHHNKFFKKVVKELSMDEAGWERASKKQFAMRRQIIRDAAKMRKLEGYREIVVMVLEASIALGVLVSFKNWYDSDIYMHDVIDLRQLIPRMPDKSNLLPVRESRPSRPTAELVKKDISKLTTEELKAQLALLREQRT